MKLIRQNQNILSPYDTKSGRSLCDTLLAGTYVSPVTKSTCCIVWTEIHES